MRSVPSSACSAREGPACRVAQWLGRARIARGDSPAAPFAAPKAQLTAEGREGSLAHRCRGLGKTLSLSAPLHVLFLLLLLPRLAVASISAVHDSCALGCRAQTCSYLNTSLSCAELSGLGCDCVRQWNIERSQNTVAHKAASRRSHPALAAHRRAAAPTCSLQSLRRNHRRRPRRPRRPNLRCCPFHLTHRRRRPRRPRRRRRRP